MLAHDIWGIGHTMLMASRQNTFVEVVTGTEEDRMQGKKNRRWWTFRLQPVLGIMPIGRTSLAQAGGLIPGTHPVFSGDELEIKETVTVNGQPAFKHLNTTGQASKIPVFLPYGMEFTFTGTPKIGGWQ